MQVSLKKSVSLVELLISISLLGVIALGAIAFHLSSERFLTSSERKTQTLNELSLVLQHLQKNILTAVGTFDTPGLVKSGNHLLITQAAGGVTYTFDIGNNQIVFQGEALTNKFVQLPGNNFSFKAGIDPGANGGVEITNLALRFNPTAAEDGKTNPEVTTIDANGNCTVYFYSLAHSW